MPHSFPLILTFYTIHSANILDWCCIKIKIFWERKKKRSSFLIAKLIENGITNGHCYEQLLPWTHLMNAIAIKCKCVLLKDEGKYWQLRTKMTELMKTAWLNPIKWNATGITSIFCTSFFFFYRVGFAILKCKASCPECEAQLCQ